MKRKIRITDEKLEQAHEYMQQWIDTENWTDLAVALEYEGDIIYAAELLVSAGAINSKNIKKHGAELYEDTAYESELVIEELARRFRKGTAKQRHNHIARTFKNCFVASCNDCNNVSFVPEGNEELYPELKTECWACHSENIETKRGIK